MSLADAKLRPRTPSAEAFATTHWSAVLAAANTPSRSSQAALEKLCAAYWPPLCCYIRRCGYAEADAQDLTQEFFSRFLAKNYLSAARRDRGRFRSFLLTCLQHFLVGEWRKAHRTKRGGQNTFVSWADDNSEEGKASADVDRLTAAEAYDQRWALTLFGNALARLRDEFAARGKGLEYEQIKPFLSAEAAEGAYVAPSRKLGLPPTTVAVMVHRLRKRYGELVREEIAQTVSTPPEVDEELAYLVSLVTR